MNDRYENRKLEKYKEEKMIERILFIIALLIVMASGYVYDKYFRTPETNMEENQTLPKTKPNVGEIHESQKENQ